MAVPTSVNSASRRPIWLHWAKRRMPPNSAACRATVRMQALKRLEPSR